MDTPRLESIGESIEKLEVAGVRIHITELDLSVLPPAYGHRGADINTRFELQDELNPYRDALPEEMALRQAERYRAIFKIFESHKSAVARVTFRGIYDGDSWKNGFPVRAAPIIRCCST